MAYIPLSQARANLGLKDTTQSSKGYVSLEEARTQLLTANKAKPTPTISKTIPTILKPKPTVKQPDFFESSKNNIIKISKSPIVGQILEGAKEFIKQVPIYIKSAIKKPRTTAEGVGEAIITFGGEIAGLIQKGINSQNIVGIGPIGIKPPPIPERWDMSKQTKAWRQLNNEILKTQGVDEQRAYEVGRVLGSIIPYTFGSAVSSTTIGAKILLPTAEKFAPQAIKFIPAINNAIGFLGIGQLEYDKEVDQSRVDRIKTDLVMLGLFEVGGVLAEGLSKVTRSTISKVVNKASIDIKSTKGADLNVLEKEVQEVKKAIKKDTRQDVGVILTNNMVKASDNEIKLLEASKKPKYTPEQKKALQTQGLKPLAEEAQKYKSADEFNNEMVKLLRQADAQGTPEEKAAFQRVKELNVVKVANLKAFYKEFAPRTGKEIIKPAVSTPPEDWKARAKVEDINLPETFTSDTQKRSIQQLVFSPKEHVQKYFNTFLQEGKPLVVSRDNAVTLFDGYTKDLDTEFDIAGGNLAKLVYRDALIKLKDDPRPVLFSAGGTGSGKTSTLSKDLTKNTYSIYFDSNLGNYDRAVQRIEETIATGKDVDVKYVYRDPEEAFKDGVMKRIIRGDDPRPVPIATHVKQHMAARDTAVRLYEKYKDNERVYISFFDNSHGKDNARKTDIEFVKNIKYNKNELERKLNEYVNKEYNQGKITKDLQETLTRGARQELSGLPEQRGTGERGKVRATEKKPSSTSVTPSQKQPPVKTKTVSVPREQLPVGEGKEKLSRLEARVTESLTKAPDDVKNLSTYKQMTKKEQIAQASKYVSENPDEALAVLRGEKEAPKGLLNNSIYVAMQNAAEGDVELARRLASLSSTRAGQEISILTEIDPNSPVKLMRDIVKIREEAFKRRYGGKSAGEVSEKVVKDIKSKVKVVDKYDWENFIRNLPTC